MYVLIIRYTLIVLCVPQFGLISLSLLHQQSYTRRNSTFIWQIFNDPDLLELHDDNGHDSDPTVTPTTSPRKTANPRATSKRDETDSSHRTRRRRRDDTDSVLDEALKQLRSMSPERGDENSDFGRVVANDLGRMSDECKLYAQKLISDILFRGKVGKLTMSTMIMDTEQWYLWLLLYTLFVNDYIHFMSRVWIDHIFINQ